MINYTAIKKSILNIIFPPYCLSCRKNLEDEISGHPFVCNDCFDNIKINNALFCPVCYTRIADKKLCHHGKKSNLYYLGFAAVYENELIKKIIWHLKYEFISDLSQSLGLIIFNYLKSFISPKIISAKVKTCDENKKTKKDKFPTGFGIKNIESYIIIPIPLHKSRLKWRGFNQSELIANELSKNIGLPAIANILIRVKKTKDQTQLSKEERISNIQNAFQIKNPAEISGKNIILLDDVYTSGATMEAAAKTLKEGGAKKIIGLVIAKG